MVLIANYGDKFIFLTLINDKNSYREERVCVVPFPARRNCTVMKNDWEK